MLAWFVRHYGLTPRDRMSQMAALAFDATVFETWPALVAGATLVLVDDELRADPASLARWLVEQRTTVAWTPTVIADALVDVAWPADTALCVMFMRTDLVRVADDSYVLFVTVRHIVTEDVFWRELWSYYEAFAAARAEPALPSLPVQYADYAAWQRGWLASDELARQVAFWTDRLHGAPEETSLPLRGPRPARLGSHARHVAGSADAAVAARPQLSVAELLALDDTERSTAP